MDANPAGARATRTRALRRRGAVCTVLIAAVALVSGVLPGSASAGNPTTPGSAQSKAASSTQLGGVGIASPTVALGTGGLVGTALALLGLSGTQLLNTLTSTIVTPLANQLTALPSTLTSGLANTITGAGLQAANGTTQQPRPAAGTFPTCGQQGWTSTNCYSLTSSNPAVTSTIGLSTGLVQGYATGDSAGYIGAAQVTNPNLSLLGVNLGNLGVVSSSAQCALTTASCSTTQSVAGGSLFGGALTLNLANGGSLIAKVGGVQVGATQVTIPGTTSTVAVNGNLATITTSLTLTQLLTALGLPNLLSALGFGSLTDNGSTITLTTKIGPGAVTSSPASAWGLDVSVDLQFDIKLNLGVTLLVGGPVNLATVEIKSSGASPDLLDLKLAYSTATAGTLLPGWVAPAVI